MKKIIGILIIMSIFIGLFICAWKRDGLKTAICAFTISGAIISLVWLAVWLMS